ncbi:hypothetical protein RA210_U30056 [Rubrivivax sp. A210]|nr:hypothetical protein RA210_U30056 [Rubrivivax sp. A210]
MPSLVTSILATALCPRRGRARHRDLPHTPQPDDLPSLTDLNSDTFRLMGLACHADVTGAH